MKASATKQRKEREREQREQQLLAAARQVLVSEGYAALTMDRLAGAIEFSKGTVYQHFHCKEDIVFALTTQTLGQRIELFHRAARFNGRTREKLTGIGVACQVFVELYPEYFRLEQIAESDPFWSKGSEERKQAMVQRNYECYHTVLGIVQEAIQQGDLVMPERLTANELVFGLWSMSKGMHAIGFGCTPVDILGIAIPFQAFMSNAQILLDGLNWQPLSATWDYTDSVRRIQQELYAAELQSIQKAQASQLIANS